MLIEIDEIQMNSIRLRALTCLRVRIAAKQGTRRSVQHAAPRTVRGHSGAGNEIWPVKRCRGLNLDHHIQKLPMNNYYQCTTVAYQVNYNTTQSQLCKYFFGTELCELKTATTIANFVNKSFYSVISGRMDIKILCRTFAAIMPHFCAKTLNER